jgi:hypothetical protein
MVLMVVVVVLLQKGSVCLPLTDSSALSRFAAMSFNEARSNMQPLVCFMFMCLSHSSSAFHISDLLFTVTLPWLKQVREAESLALLSAASGRSRHGFEEHIPGSFHDM